MIFFQLIAIELLISFTKINCNRFRYCSVIILHNFNDHFYNFANLFCIDFIQGGILKKLYFAIYKENFACNFQCLKFLKAGLPFDRTGVFAPTLHPGAAFFNCLVMLKDVEDMFPATK